MEVTLMNGSKALYNYKFAFGTSEYFPGMKYLNNIVLNYISFFEFHTWTVDK